ncbi:MAG: hypothetical protein KDE51_17695 [Anaerolineales bacterium]|nr:hypothetical protein [Anaerolineales bacterium]
MNVYELPTLDVSDARIRTGQTLTAVGLGLDTVELLISYAAIYGQIPAGISGGPLGILLERVLTDGGETAVSLITAFVNTGNDFIVGNSYIDERTNELVIGQASIVEALELLADILTHGPEADAGLNTIVAMNDIYQLLVDDKVQLRVSLSPGHQSYFVVDPFSHDIFNWTTLPYMKLRENFLPPDER